jgi:dihydroneopterin aldolase/D-erythro-7,8-dihydroneopterin triphosphate epimerase
VRPATLDRLFIRDLQVRCNVGVTAAERGKKQDLLLTVTLWADLRKAGRTDRLADTVDYKAIKLRIVSEVEGGTFRLIERVAERVAGICLDDPKVARVEVSVQKPAALRFARCSEVVIARERGSGTG